MGGLRWAWGRLTSMRTAVVLLVLVALAAVPGSLLPQRNVATAPNAVPTFFDDHPTLAPWLDRVGLFDVYATPWFAATYLLLLISMTGCVVPRCARLWRETRAVPPAAPRRLEREHGAETWTDERRPDAVLDAAAVGLRERRYRVVVTDTEVRAERGYSRELGNLVFHLSLLVLLVGVAGGRLFGYEGRVAVPEGGTFTNVAGEYDSLTPSVWTDVDDLEPLAFTLDEFDAEFATSGAKVGEPRAFDAQLTVTESGQTYRRTVRPNQPLDVEGTKFFLTGHGYAPRVTVRDGAGDVVFSGPAVLLPSDANLTSDGAVKAPDARPLPLGFEAVFLPTAGGPDSPALSFFPGLVNPRLDLTAWTGDLGLADAAQSVFTLDTSRLTRLRDSSGEPVTLSLRPGDRADLPDGAGSVTFDGVARFANFQVARDPGKEISLFAAVLLLTGLTVSLAVRRRRVWVRVTELAATSGVRVDVAGRSLTRRGFPPDELPRLIGALRTRSAPVRSEENVP